MASVSIVVQRFDPTRDREPYWQRYEVVVGPNHTLLDVLLEVRDLQDGTLAFRRSCRSGICGSCAVAVNGRPQLACMTRVLEALGPSGSVTIAPLPGFPVLRDLVVDIDPFFESLRALLPWLLRRPDYPGTMEPPTVDAAMEGALCILCGACQAGAGGVGAANPAALAQGVRFALDPRDLLGPVRLWMLSEAGLLSPEAAERWERSCPKQIPLAALAARGREMLARQPLAPAACWERSA